MYALHVRKLRFKVDQAIIVKIESEFSHLIVLCISINIVWIFDLQIFRIEPIILEIG